LIRESAGIPTTMHSPPNSPAGDSERIAMSTGNELAALHWPWIALPNANIMTWVLGPNTDSRVMLLDYVESYLF
jgi:hypothetical protein